MEENTYEPIPTKKNIEYAFQRLVTPIEFAIDFKPYEESKKEFEEILDTIKKWIIIYTNTNDLNQINWEQFIEIRQQLFELDSKYLPSDGFYAEDAYEWALQLQVLIEKSIKEDKNAI